MSIPRVLSEEEKQELERLEAILVREQRSFVELGEALKSFREQELYRQEFGTFEEYCLKRLEMSKPRAYQLMAIAEVARNLSTMVDVPAPRNERQVRQLTRLTPEQQREVWRLAVAESHGGVPSSATVERLMRAHHLDLLGWWNEPGEEALRSLYFRLEEMIYQCRKLHAGFYDVADRLSVILESYVETVRRSRVMPRRAAG
jgi:hypothetical protein